MCTEGGGGVSFLRAHQLRAESRLEFDFLLLCGGSQQSMAAGGGCGMLLCVPLLLLSASPSPYQRGSGHL